MDHDIQNKRIDSRVKCDVLGGQRTRDQDVKPPGGSAKPRCLVATVQTQHLPQKGKIISL